MRTSEDKLQRIIPSLEVQRIQTVFDTKLAQIGHLSLRDRQIYDLSENVDWAGGYWRKFSLLDGRFSEEIKSKVRRKYGVSSTPRPRG